jgi:hypothetical protein
MSQEVVMGFEVFRVELRGGRVKFHEAEEAVRQFPHALPDQDSPPIPGSSYYFVGDGQHVIEVEIMDSPVRVSCRFTLCHPASVDTVFLGVLRQLMIRLGMEARICDNVYPDHSRSFSLQDFPTFSAIASQYIAARRMEWITAFGYEPMTATTNEVYERVILPHCQPGIEPHRLFSNGRDV